MIVIMERVSDIRVRLRTRLHGDQRGPRDRHHRPARCLHDQLGGRPPTRPQEVAHRDEDVVDAARGEVTGRDGGGGADGDVGVEVGGDGGDTGGDGAGHCGGDEGEDGGESGERVLMGFF